MLQHAAGPAPHAGQHGDAPSRQPGVRRSPIEGPPAAALHLQMLAGNAAVARLVAGTPGAVGSTAGPDAGSPANGPATESAPGSVGLSLTPIPARGAQADRGPSAAADGRPAQVPGATVQRGILDDVAGGVASIAGGARDSVLQTLAGWARRMPGYELLCTILGRDVVAGTPVPRSAAAIISGFLGIMPRGEELRQQLQQSGAIDRAGAWFEQEVPKLGLTWDLLRGLFSRAWDALSATDLLDPEGAWERISRIFGPPLARLRDFAVGAVTKVAEFVFEGAMSMAGGLGTQVMGIIRQAGDVFHQILRDPVGFAGNLVAAVRGGLGAFLSNVGTHLRNGLIGWLTGSLGGLIRLPAQFDLRGILGMAMEFLGLTWQNIRTRIAALIGERALGLLERGAGIVADVARNGISAITARIAQFTSGLVDTVLGGIRDWVTNSVVGAAITRLLSMFNPAGAVIQAIIAVYNTIQFFIERAQQLGALANSVFTSIGAIAAGSIGNAVNAVEQALGRAVPVVLGFLARLIGLGDIATPVRNVMTRVRGVIDSAIDRVVGWIAGMARRVRGALSGRSARQGAGQGTSDLAPALRDASGLLDVSGATPASVRAGLAGLRQRHGLQLAELVPSRTEGAFHVHVQKSDADTDDENLATETTPGTSSQPVALAGVRIPLSDRRAGRLEKAEKTDKWTDLPGRDRTSLGKAYNHIIQTLVREIASGGRSRVFHYASVTAALIAELRAGGGRVIFTEGRLNGGALRFDIAEIDFDSKTVAVVDLTAMRDPSHAAKTGAYSSELAKLTGFPVDAFEARYVGDDAKLAEEILIVPATRT